MLPAKTKRDRDFSSGGTGAFPRIVLELRGGGRHGSKYSVCVGGV